MPKIELHDHLDGGLRLETILELAEMEHIALPGSTVEELQPFIFARQGGGNLDKYLEAFRFTVSVLQTERALERVAYEAVEAWSKENIVYAEVRFAPKQHTRRGLSLGQTVEAVLKGLQRGKAAFGVDSGLIICAMRDQSDSPMIARLAAEYAAKGVVGFDLAGPEKAYPASLHKDAYHIAHRAHLGTTCHAGEEGSVSLIAEAIEICHTGRIGHGTQLINDFDLSLTPQPASLSRYILDRQIPIEICLTSNVQTGAVPTLPQHPFGRLFHLGFNVCLCTDNRVVSQTNLTAEISQAAEYFHLERAHLLKLQENALFASFLPWEKKAQLLQEKIKPYFA